MLKIGTYGPCILIQKPYTVGYRQHMASSHLNVRAMSDGIVGLVRTERNGQYPGGKQRRFARYACIGGLSASFAVRHCWRQGFRWQAVQLVARTSPMVLAAVWDQFLRRFRKPTPSIVLSPSSPVPSVPRS
jgi:hypothetical protein